MQIVLIFSDLMKMDKKCERGSYVRLVDKILDIVITRLKDGQIIQVVSTTKESKTGLI